MAARNLALILGCGLGFLPSGFGQQASSAPKEVPALEEQDLQQQAWVFLTTAAGWAKIERYEAEEGIKALEP